MRELKEMNLEITKKYMAGKTISELAKEYRKGNSNIARIVRETGNKYPDIINSNK